MKTIIENDGYRDPLYWNYEGLQESIDSIFHSKSYQEKIPLLIKAIEKYPHYYDFYIELFYAYMDRDNEADMDIIEKGYTLAINRLKKENDGKLPKVMNWYFIENRHIHRIIYNYAECLSKIGEYKKSNRLLNTLLRMHRSDNIGARFLKEENLQKTKRKAKESSEIKDSTIVLTEDEYGDNIARTALLLQEAISLGRTSEIKSLTNLLIRDLRGFAKENFTKPNNPYIKTLQSLKLEHLLNLCSSCLEAKTGGLQLILHGEYWDYFDTGVCKACHKTNEVFVGRREDLLGETSSKHHKNSHKTR